MRPEAKFIRISLTLILRIIHTPIHMAAQNGYLSICELLINWIETTYPDDIEYANAENADGNTPLHLAASYGHLAVCQFLVEKVEHTNGENVFGATPLLCAVENYRSAIFHLIFECTVDKRNINIGDNHGQTPLLSAAANDFFIIHFHPHPYRSTPACVSEGQCLWSVVT